MARKTIPKDIEEAVLAACRRRCAICFGFNRDMLIKQGQIAHLDGDPENDSQENLVFLCLDHHDQFDTRTSQSKGLTIGEVRRFRTELCGSIELALRQPVNFGTVQVEPPDEVAGHWVRDGANDSSEIQIERLTANRIRVQGVALHGKTWDIGPNLGQLDFEAELVGSVASFADPMPGGAVYRVQLRFEGNLLTTEEDNAFGHFGAGAHFQGRYERLR
jgi:hypothetical protein